MENRKLRIKHSAMRYITFETTSGIDS